MISVEVRNLVFSYSDKTLADSVLKGLNFSIPSGALVAIVGPNGSGKSTLLKVMSGFLSPTDGSVSIQGQGIHGVSAKVRSRLVTYYGDEPEPAFDFTVEEIVRMGRFSYQDGGDDSGPERMTEALEKADVSHLRYRPVTQISSGERQRVYLARALYQDPQVLLMDEPTSHLDMAYELKVMDTVKKMASRDKKTVVTVLHDLNLALRYTSLILFLKDGRIVFAAEPGNVTESMIEVVYGLRVKILKEPSLGYPVVLPLCPISQNEPNLGARP